MSIDISLILILLKQLSSRTTKQWNDHLHHLILGEDGTHGFHT